MRKLVGVLPVPFHAALLADDFFLAAFSASARFIAQWRFVASMIRRHRG
jgi:hypothetical protein